MMRAAARSFVLVTGLTLVFGVRAWAGNWPQWRGPTGDSVSDETNLPIAWSEKDNIAWKCPLPGQGASTPAIWGNAVFVTTQQDENLLVLKIDKTTGKVEWTQEVGTGTPLRTAPKGKQGKESREQKFHGLHNMASPSPVTDGERVIVHFGNGDLAAYDFAGKQLWYRNLQKDHGMYSIWWGHANSPVLYHDLVITVCMQDSLVDLPEAERADSYLVAHDKRTGEEKWKTLRKTQAKAEECDSYTTPLLHLAGGRAELIVMGGNQIDAYDPVTGKQLWYLPGIVGGRTITGPTQSHDLVYATQGMRGPLLAVRLGETGRLAPSAVVWKQTQATPDTCCPVLWKDLLFLISDNGIVQCYDAQTGKLHWKERLPGDFKASPLAADGKVYFLNLAGECTVVAAAPRFEKPVVNKVADGTIASPAVSDGRLFLRGNKALYCIGSPLR
jgi:outer membrane protein assembly factor BamB